MQRIFLILFLFGAALAGGYSAARFKAVDLLRARFQGQSADFQNAVFRPYAYPLKNRPFVCILIGRNNGASAQKTLDSVFSQCYEPFRLVYVDDGSDDGSDALVADLLADPIRSAKTHFIRNKQPRGQLCNLVEVVKECSDEEIVVVFDGQDRLAHEWVLQRLNQYYEDPDLWLAYPQCFEYSTCQVRSFPSYLGNARESQGAFFHIPRLQTFYASLFKRVDDGDLRYQGEYIQGPLDIAYMLPMLEMAEGHFQCLPDVLYISFKNDSQELWEHQALFEKHIRSLKSYDGIDSSVKGAVLVNPLCFY